MRKTGTPSVIFEMIRSFLVLARTLNVSKTAEDLNLSRQTVKRHIAELEDLKGMKLFEVTNRQYFLTQDGTAELEGAETLLERLDSWLDKEYELVAGLPRIHFKTDIEEFWAQRYPASDLWNRAPPLLQRGLKSWGESEAQLDHPKLKKIRPYLIIYRRLKHDWICVEVGEKSAYSSWLGWQWAKSVIGLSFRKDPISTSSDCFIVDAYDTVARTGGVWYDHIHTKLPRTSYEELQPVSYQRLIMSLFFPDGQQAIAALVARTNRVNIRGLASETLPLMSEEDLMEFDV